MLNFSGFTNAQANRLRVDDFNSSDEIEIETLENQDTKDLATTFSLLPAIIHISFGIARTKRLIRMMHWVQDHECVSLTDSVSVGTTQLEMLDTWSKALRRANYRSDAAKKAKAEHTRVDLGELKSDNGFYNSDSK